VPTAEVAEPSPEPEDSNLLDLTDEPGVPNVAVKRRSVADLLRDQELGEAA
jgi:hypothetical protein